MLRLTICAALVGIVAGCEARTTTPPGSKTEINVDAGRRPGVDVEVRDRDRVVTPPAEQKKVQVDVGPVHVDAPANPNAAERREERREQREQIREERREDAAKPAAP